MSKELSDERKEFELSPFLFSEVAVSCENIFVSVAEVIVNAEITEKEIQDEVLDANINEELGTVEWVEVKRVTKRQFIKFTVENYQECWVLVLVEFADSSKKPYIFHLGKHRIDISGDLFLFIDDLVRSAHH